MAQRPVEVSDGRPGKCKVHPRYEAKAKPRSKCQQCWKLYLASLTGTLASTR